MKMQIQNAMETPGRLDLSTPAARRRFFIERSYRFAPRSPSNDLHALMRLPGRLHEKHGIAMINEMFGDIEVCLVGAHAVAASAPERMTQDVDCLTRAAEYKLAQNLLRANGYRELGAANYSSSSLGLFGTRWSPEKLGPPIDLISSEHDWVLEAFSIGPVFTNDGDRVLPLAYLVLIKMDTARSGDQFDLGRMLGRINDIEVSAIAEIVGRHLSDPTIVEDLRQSAEIGRWEYRAP